MITAYDHYFYFKVYIAEIETARMGSRQIPNPGHHNRSHATISNYLKNFQSNITVIKPMKVT